MAESLDFNSECTLRCENHFSVLISKLKNLLAHKKFVDVTLIVEDQFIKAHRIILIAFSQYFEEHFSTQLDDGTLHEVTLQGVRADSIKALIQYMYTGEVTVSRDQLPLLLETASFLKMEGFKMGVQEKDVSNGQMSTLSSSNSCWEAIVIKKETDEHKAVAVGSSDEDHLLVAYLPISKTAAIKEELMEFEDQSQEMEVMVLDLVGVASNLPVPISFKRRYSTEDEAAEADDDRRDEVTVEQIDTVMEQIPENDNGKSEMSGQHSSLNVDDDVSSIVDSSDENASSSMAKPSQTLKNQQATPSKKKSCLKAQKIAPEPPFKCTANECGRSYKRKGELNRHLKYECGTQPHFLCTQCEQRFTHKENLRRHLTNIHKIDRSQHASYIPGQHSRPTYHFKCDRCERTYKLKRNLLRHRNQECGVEPSFACDHCDYRAAQKSTLKEHIIFIHG